jgi:hypothetical protein
MQFCESYTKTGNCSRRSDVPTATTVDGTAVQSKKKQLTAMFFGVTGDWLLGGKKHM